MKKFLAIVLTVITLLSVAVFPAMATENITVIVDGQVLAFDVPPQLINNRTMVPLRAIFEKLGATVRWDNTNQRVTATKGDIEISLQIGNSLMFVGNKVVVLDSVPIETGGRTLVPVRAISESFNAKVEWKEETNTVVITTNAVSNVPIEQNPPKEDKTENIIPASTTVFHNEYSFEPIREFNIECTNVIRGSKANSIISSENMFNDKPSSAQEWIILEFDVEYISSTDGINDEIGASDIIYRDTFYTKNRSSMPVYDKATLGDVYGAYDVFKVKMYPGSSSKVVIGLLTDKNIETILLRVPNVSKNDVTWIECAGKSDSLNSGENKKEETIVQTNTNYYQGTTIPTYTSVTGVSLYNQTRLDNGKTVYMYKYTDADDVGDYWRKLISLGWTILKGDDKTTATTFESSYYKGSDFIIVNIYLETNQVWIVPSK